MVIACACVVRRVRATGRCGRPRSCRTTTRISSTSRRRNEEEGPKRRRTKKKKRSNRWRSTWWRRSRRPLRPPSEGEEAEAGEGEASRDEDEQAAPSRRAGVEHEEAGEGEVEPRGVVETNSHRRTTSFSNTRAIYSSCSSARLSCPHVGVDVQVQVIVVVHRRRALSCTRGCRKGGSGGRIEGEGRE